MKKWTYLAVTGMLLGTAPVFTGCIDNDEPEGITILRQAKSELLRARASVEEANAASILADAALKEAQKAVVAAQARYYEALAAEQEAKALKAQYEAELRNIKNEEERARLEALISQLESPAAGTRTSGSTGRRTTGTGPDGSEDGTGQTASLV